MNLFQEGSSYPAREGEGGRVARIITLHYPLVPLSLFNDIGALSEQISNERSVVPLIDLHLGVIKPAKPTEGKV